MASKRPAPDIHPSRREQVPREPARKKIKPNHGTKSFKKAHPVNEIKTQIRSLKRLLSSSDLPPGVRITKERALAQAQNELTESQAADRRSKMIARYHKVRFFDRQKATKRLKKARKALKECEDVGEREELGKQVDEYELDVNYAMYYPLDVPYAALFPSNKIKSEGEDGEVDEFKAKPAGIEERKGDPKMRELVRKCMANGKQDKLRTGKLDENGEYKVTKRTEDESPPPKAKTATGKEDRSGKRKAVTLEPEESEAESDGGFFE